MMMKLILSLCVAGVLFFVGASARSYPLRPYELTGNTLIKYLVYGGVCFTFIEVSFEMVEETSAPGENR